MSTYLTMQDRIIDEMKRPDLRAQIKNAIQSAIRFYKDEAFYEAETSTETPISCVEGQREYDLPTDFSTPVVARLRYDGVIDPLHVITIEQMDELDSDDVPSPGRPQKIVYYGRKFHLWPRPQSATYAVELRYNSNIEAPVADDDEGFWMNEAERMIRTKSKSYIWADVLKDYEKAAAEDILAGTEHRRLIGVTEGRHYTNGVRAHL